VCLDGNGRLDKQRTLLSLPTKLKKESKKQVNWFGVVVGQDKHYHFQKPKQISSLLISAEGQEKE
jgi:hypothetical protein